MSDLAAKAKSMLDSKERLLRSQGIGPNELDELFDRLLAEGKNYIAGSEERLVLGFAMFGVLIIHAERFMEDPAEAK